MKKLKKSNDGYYSFWDGDEQLETPGGVPCSIKSKAIADRVLQDWKLDAFSFSGDSSLPWIYTYQENFLRMGEDAVRGVLVQCFKKAGDWTFHCESPDPHILMRFMNWFGQYETRWTEIQKMIDNANLLQLTAACCVGNAFHSINIAYVFTVIMEQCKTEEEKLEALDQIGDFVEYYCGEDTDFLKRVYWLFEIFWNDKDQASVVE